MPKVRTHYDNLKVARDAPFEVIRAAYKSLSQKYHPDRNPGDPKAARTMAIINAAYRVLSDANLRKAHDEWIRKAEAKLDPEPETRAEPPPPRPAKAPKPAAPMYVSKYGFINHLWRYRWVYLFLIAVEVLLITTIVVLDRG